MHTHGEFFVTGLPITAAAHENVFTLMKVPKK